MCSCQFMAIRMMSKTLEWSNEVQVLKPTCASLAVTTGLVRQRVKSRWSAGKSVHK